MGRRLDLIRQRRAECARACSGAGCAQGAAEIALPLPDRCRQSRMALSVRLASARDEWTVTGPR